MKFLIKVTLAIISCALAIHAGAMVITFEGFNNIAYNTPITHSGFDIGNTGGQAQQFYDITDTGFVLPNNGNVVLLNNSDAHLFVEQAGGAAFRLTGVEVAAAFSNGPAVRLQVEGFLHNVSTAVVTLGSLGSGYTTLLEAALGMIDRLIFDGLGAAGQFLLDQLALKDNTPVPEPPSIALLSIGLLGLITLRHRNQRRL